MMESAWKELDDKVIQCKEFEDRNRGHFEQVMTGIARLWELIADWQRVISETIEFINTKDLEIRAVQVTLKQENEDCTKLMTNDSASKEVIRRTKKSERSNGVMVMMDVMLKDLDEEKSTATAVEKDAQTDYETLMKKSAENRVRYVRQKDRGHRERVSSARWASTMT